MFDFSLTPELVELRDRTRAFVHDVVIPAEKDFPAYEVQSPEELKVLTARLEVLRVQARAAGLFAPHVVKEWGGMGLTMCEMAIVFEEAGQSLLGPLALNCSAPDEGNMHLLEIVATEQQKEHYLQPLVAGQIRSCFAMTEPAPGAGSDPALLQTYARRERGGWLINGRKWYTTGADGAAFAICMARTDGERPVEPADQRTSKLEATMFLVDIDNPGFRIVRHVPSMDVNYFGGHCEVVFEDCFVPEAEVLGEVGQGFRYAQLRLAPARLTHCMRWLGIAQRSLAIAAHYATTRESFGRPLGKHQMVGAMLADSAMEIHAARLMIWHAAWLLDRGEQARQETSMTKIFVAETVHKVIDRCVQICGAAGISEDLPLSLFYRSARAFRIYDGPSEVHRAVVAHRILKQYAE
jgi:Acyl-CoA dehydrogenases